ncbi:unnamed protein product [Caenorhabditis bovis]|uniref:Cytochrome P450 n=1 Tax=Caenorhabditis bovis TaxID=2654633 RepID=A0A8S1EWV7_9PELO|nr:unnamed protein product [Caenorhabditis bovis]
MALLFLLAITASIGVITYYLFAWTYWYRRGIPGPLGLPFLGCLPQMFNKVSPAILKIQKWTKKYGRVYGFTEGPSRTLVISDPELANEVFVKQFDNFNARKLNAFQGDPDDEPQTHLFEARGFRWKRLRNITSPSFSNSSLRKVMAKIHLSADELMKHLEDKWKCGKSVDISKFYQEYTMELICRVAIGQIESKMFNNPLIENIHKLFSSQIPFIFCGTFPHLANFARIACLVFRKQFGLESFFEITNLSTKAINDRIDSRKENEQNGIKYEGPNDFIDLFLDAKVDENLWKNETGSTFSSKNSTKIEKKLSIDEIVAQCVLFLTAGFDTTSTSLSFVTYFIAKHQDVQEKLFNEIAENCPNMEFSFDNLAKLKYMECVIDETLRLYPFATAAYSRKCTNSTKIGNIDIEEGTNILVDVITMHTDEDIWGPDAKQFNPERFENRKDIPRGAYIPFGAGPRICVGMRLSILEQKLLLAAILNRYKIKLCEETEDPIVLEGSFTAKPRTMVVKLEKRRNETSD